MKWLILLLGLVATTATAKTLKDVDQAVFTKQDGKFMLCIEDACFDIERGVIEWLKLNPPPDPNKTCEGSVCTLKEVHI